MTPIAEPASFAEQAAKWLKSLPRDQYPNTVDLADTLVAGSADDRFEWGQLPDVAADARGPLAGTWLR